MLTSVLDKANLDKATRILSMHIRVLLRVGLFNGIQQQIIELLRVFSRCPLQFTSRL